RRTDEFETDEVGIEIGNGERGELVANLGELLGRRADPAVFARPGWHREAAALERGEIITAGGEVVIARAEYGSRGGGARSQACGQLGAHVGHTRATSSRSGAFCTLPLAVRGSVGRNSRRSGILNRARPKLRRCARSTSSDGCAPSRGTTNAHTR